MRVPPDFLSIQPLPGSPLGWNDYDYAVLNDGSLALVRIDLDFSEMSEQSQRGAWPHTRLRLSRLDNETEVDTTETPASMWPKVDRFTDGRWLVTAPRAGPGELNVCLYEAGGAPAGNFAIGDAVLHVSCTPGGTLWVGYFDEHNERSGLAAFDAKGARVWEFPADDYGILDCYALSTTGEVAWACPYVDFPILRIAGGTVRSWENRILGARAIAGDGDHVILAGGYDTDEDRVVLLRLGERQAEPIAAFQWPLIAERGAYVGGRNGVLHAVAGGQWLRLPIKDWVAALG